MRDFKKRHNRTALLLELGRGLGWLLILVVVAFFAARGAWGMYQKFAEAAEARSQAEAQLSDLQARYVSVKAQVDTLGTPRGVEAAVRERYGVALPGEGEIDIVQQASSSPDAPHTQSLWQKLWQLLFVW